MIDTENVNPPAQNIYELAKEPVFVDRSGDDNPIISWDVPSAEETEHSLDNNNENEKDVSPDELLPQEENDVGEEEKENEEEKIDEEERERKKKKNRSSEKNRISQLSQKLRHAQSVTHDVLARNKFLEKKIRDKERESLTDKENYLNSQKERVKQYLVDALEEGDSNKISDAQDLLSQFNSEILRINSHKQSINEIPENYSYNNPSYESDPINFNESVIEARNEWVERNSWANEKSSDFDNDLFEEANNYSITLYKKYKLQGRSDEIGTSEFFDEITDHLKNKYLISDNESPYNKPPPRNRTPMKSGQSSPVGTVNRQRTQGVHTGNTIKSKDIILTPAQKEAAYALRGYVRDPKTGVKITDNKMLEEIYKNNMMRGN